MELEIVKIIKDQCIVSENRANSVPSSWKLHNPPDPKIHKESLKPSVVAKCCYYQELYLLLLFPVMFLYCYARV